MLKSHELLGFMSPALANEIISSAHETDKPTYKAALAAVADARHVRPKYLEHQARPQRHATMLPSRRNHLPGLRSIERLAHYGDPVLTYKKRAAHGERPS